LEDLRGGRVRHNVKNAEILHRALKDAGINFAAMVPDSYFREVNRLLQEDRDIESVTATREDEGMAICAGAYMGGKNPCMVMEASGYGSGAGVLARICQIHHTPFLILSSHVAGLGGTQHELFTLGDRDANLYATGIGLVSQVALGLAIALPKRKIIALDGDGSSVLNLGILPVLAQQTPPNLLVVVFDNGLYESGGQHRHSIGIRRGSGCASERGRYREYKDYRLARCFQSAFENRAQGACL